MNRTVKRSIIGILVSALLVIFDQVTKSLAVTHLKGQDAFVIWDGVSELRYLENNGAAFGIMQGQKIIFVLLQQLR